MPFNELDPQARLKERQLESFLQLWLRKFIPTLQHPPGWAGEGSIVPAEQPTIMLYPTNQGSQMPIVDPKYLQEKARTRGKGGPA